MLRAYGTSAKPALKCSQLFLSCAPACADSQMCPWCLAAASRLRTRAVPSRVSSRWQQPGCSGAAGSAPARASRVSEKSGITALEYPPIQPRAAAFWCERLRALQSRVGRRRCWVSPKGLVSQGKRGRAQLTAEHLPRWGRDWRRGE